MKLAQRYLALVFLLIILTLTIANLPLTIEAVKSGVEAGNGLPGLTEKVKAAYLTDDFSNKTGFVDLAGLHARLTGRQKFNDVVKLRNGMLAYETETVGDAGGRAASVAKFAAWLEARGTAFLYVQMPYKMDLSESLMPTGLANTVHRNADDMVDTLLELGVPTLDLREEICATPETLQQYFHATDHHWNALGALKGFQLTAEKLQEIFPQELATLPTVTETESWQVETFADRFLGSQGKRVGKFYAGVDDLVLVTPNFPTAMSMSNMKYRRFTSGDFETAILQKEYLVDEVSYHTQNHYAVYVGGDYPLVQHRNALAPLNKKVLIIKDSFALPYQSFMSTLFTAVDVIDPRHYTEQPVADYIMQYEPDLVLLAINPNMIFQQAYTQFGQGDAKAFYQLETIAQQDVTVPVAETDYTFASLSPALEADALYCLRMEDVTRTAGNAKAVSVTLYERVTKKQHASFIFDLDYCAYTGDYTWYFRVPATETPCELLFYAGLPGSTTGNGFTFGNVTVSKVSVAYPEGYVPQEETLLFQQDVTVYPLENDYNYETIPVSLKPGAKYRLSIESLAIDAGSTDTLTVSLYDTLIKTRLRSHHFALQGMASGYVWDFDVPEDATEGVRVLIYAGKLGETGNIGVTCNNVVLERTDLLPEGQQPAAATQVYTRIEPRNVTIQPSEDGYNYGSFNLALEPGATYALSTQEMTLDAGQAESIDVSLFHPATKTHLLTTSIPVAQGENVWRFQAPAGGDACQLLLYAGKRGETNGVGVTISGLSLVMEQEAPLGVALSQQDIVIESTTDDYHYIALNAALLPDTLYQLSVSGVEITAGQAEKLSFSLYDPTSREQLARGNIALTGGEPYTWDFITPAEEASLWQVLVYAGERGKTANVSLTLKELTVTEAE
ncbi:MAG: hypothetical protein E7316_01845 [Clostridiales bacterium]|nr:hypothetical protein [Clostridiales bacterium]